LIVKRITPLPFRLGTAFLLAAIVGSGIMAGRLAVVSAGFFALLAAPLMLRVEPKHRRRASESEAGHLRSREAEDHDRDFAINCKQ
jgi:hypothetical protein